MSDSEDSIHNELLTRITRKRTGKEPDLRIKTPKKHQAPVEVPMPEEPEPEKKVKFEKPEPEPEETQEPEEESEEDQEEDQEEEPEPEANIPEDAKKLEKAQSEAKKLKRKVLRGTAEPSSKLRRLVRKRRKEKEAESERDDPVLDELRSLREEITRMKDFQQKTYQKQNENVAVLTDNQSQLLGKLLGRRW